MPRLIWNNFGFQKSYQAQVFESFDVKSITLEIKTLVKNEPIINLYGFKNLN